MTQNDLSQVLAIECENYFDPWTLQIFSDCLRVGYQCDVLVSQNKIIGYSILMQVLDEAHLLNIAIGKKYQGQGVGSYFLKGLINKVKNNHCKQLFLEVRMSNTAAIKMYENVGFIKVGTRKNYYTGEHGREDAILYTLNLT